MSSDPSALLCPCQQVRKSWGPWCGCPGCDPGLRALISSALVLSAGIRMRKHLVLGPACIHVPCLQVCAGTGGGICPGAGRKGTDLDLSQSWEWIAWSNYHSGVSKIHHIWEWWRSENDSLFKICLGFQLLVSFLSALHANDSWLCPSIACGALIGSWR